MDFVQEGYRLGIKEAAQDDASDVLKFLENSNFYRALPYKPPKKHEEIKKFLSDQEKDFFLFIGVQKRNMEKIGICMVRPIESREGNVAIAFGIKEPKGGMRLALEMLDLLVAYVFGRFNAVRLEAEVPTDNHKAQRVLGLVGFHHEGTLRKSQVIEGRRRDIQVWGLIEEDLLIGQ